MFNLYKNRKYHNLIQQKEFELKELKQCISEQDSLQLEHNLKIEDNHIYLYTEINDKSLLFLKTSLQKLIYSYKQTQLVYPQISNQALSIHIHIASNGGDLFSGFCMYDIIKKCQYTIHSYIEGFAASAATLPFLGAKYRHMHENSFILIHQYSTSFWGTYKYLQDQIQSGNKLMSKLQTIYLLNSNLSKQKLDELLQSDLWLTYQQAKQIGFINI